MIQSQRTSGPKWPVAEGVEFSIQRTVTAATKLKDACSLKGKL